MSDLPRLAAWLATLIVFGVPSNWLGPKLHDGGGPILLGAIGLAAVTAFWWFSIWLLLGGRLSSGGSRSSLTMGQEVLPGSLGVQ